MSIRTRPQPVIPLVRVVAFAALLAVLLIAALFPLPFGNSSLSQGRIASQTIRAPAEVRYESTFLRNQLQEQRADAVQSVLTYDVNVKAQQLAKLNELVTRITNWRDTAGLTRAVREEGIRLIQGANLNANQRKLILDFTSEEWNRTVDEANRLLSQVLEEPFTANERETRQASVRNRVQNGLLATQGEVAAALAQPLVIETQIKNEAETEKAKEKARAGVEPQIQTYAKGQVIVREGDAIDQVKYEALAAAGLLSYRLNRLDLAAVALVAVLAAGVLGLYLHVSQPQAVASLRRLIASAGLIAGLVLAAKLYLPLVLPDTGRHFLAYVLPVAAVPLLLAALFEAPFALITAAVCAMLATFTALYIPDVTGVVSLTGNQPLQMCAAYLFGGLAGVLVIHRAERLNRFFLAGVAVTVATFLGLLAFWLLDGSRERIDLAWMAAASVMAGGFSAVLTVGAFALLATVFGVTTRLQLMELAQLNAPLLRRLQDEAPGTFHHSIIVGNLAERAADLIGADSLLVRVGSYYHDIGKMARPGFFIENQLSGLNPHDGLDPATSAGILQEHVGHGLELARRHHLPERVRDFIPEHHGTRLVAYFYRLAAQDDPEVDPAGFSYSGPRPRSRETAVVMLADSTEAMVRAAKDRSQERIDAMVESVIAERLAEGQFDDCDLTLRDLRVIAQSFKQSLRAIYHPRVEYPAPSPAEQRRRHAAALPPASQNRLTVISGGQAAAPAGETETPAAAEDARVPAREEGARPAAGASGS
jgi:putative nucleotidyltransferase with HDIG domain